MKIISTVLIISFLLVTGAFAQASDILSYGIWQIVELEPKGDNPLDKLDMYLVIMPNGSMMEVSIPKDGKSSPETKIFKYKYKDGLLIRIDKNDTTEHVITQIGTRVKMGVPFGGYLWLQKIPTK